jgi:spore germination protein Q
MRNFYPPMGGFPPYYQNMYPQYELPPIVEPSQFREESYIENILRLNKGKIVTIYMNFENSQWGSKIFKGKIEAAGKDHIIITDINSNIRYVLLTIYLDYFTFDEEINYDYPIGNLQYKK